MAGTIERRNSCWHLDLGILSFAPKALGLAQTYTRHLEANGHDVNSQGWRVPNGRNVRMQQYDV